MPAEYGYYYLPQGEYSYNIGAMIARFTGQNVGILLIAYLISLCFKQRTHKIVASICTIIIMYFGIYGGTNSPVLQGINKYDIIFGEICAWGVIAGVFIVFKILQHAFKDLYTNHIEPAQQKHEDNKSKYRKYIIKCDKQGKHPLNYKQWKFAYGTVRNKD